MLVREWMTAPPILVAPRTSAHAALRLMEQRKIRRLPVEDESGLVGIVTKSDIQSKLGPFPLSWRRLNLRVTDVMTREPFSVGPDDSLSRVAGLMLAHKISGVPVVEGGKTVGIVTESDVFRAFSEALGILEGGGTRAA
ncbi:MAG TPA: CBS domain-containing protein [Planctomycetota bacterium]